LKAQGEAAEVAREVAQEVAQEVAVFEQVAAAMAYRIRLHRLLRSRPSAR
jgi:hypothetical protein